MSYKLRVMETFAGIGVQHKAIKNSCDDYFEVVKICEWDARAIISYANIHYNFNVDKFLFQNDIFNKKDINNFLSKKYSHLIQKTFKFIR